MSEYELPFAEGPDQDQERWVRLPVEECRHLMVWALSDDIAQRLLTAAGDGYEPPTVIIEVEGGLVSNTHSPEGIDVGTVDWDIVETEIGIDPFDIHNPRLLKAYFESGPDNDYLPIRQEVVRG